jgi:hypothetical protein
MKHNFYFLSFILLLLASCQEPVEPIFVDYRQDVTEMQIIDEDFVVGGELTPNSNQSRVLKVINLPPRTKYWVFWFGVSQEAKEKYMQTAELIPKAAKAITSSPVIALGLEIISAINLAANSGSDNLDVYFAAGADNAQKFLNNQSWYYEGFFYGQQTVNSYRVVQMSDVNPDANRRLYMTFKNNRSFRDADVSLKVWAFIEK